MAQDNDGFRERVTSAVLDAVIEAGRVHHGARDIRLDMSAALEGMCRALAIFASMGPQMVDREKAVEIMADIEERVVAQLRFLTDKIKDGSLHGEHRPRPDLRIVE